MTVLGDLPGEAWDAVVVGSGLGGLTTAAYLATNGVRPLVLEQGRVAGGCSQVFRRQRRFEFDVGVHYIGACQEDGLLTGILRGVGLADRVEFVEMDPDGFTTLVFPDFTFRVPRGWDRYLERLVETFPDEERGLRLCVRLLRRMSAELRKGLPTTPKQALLFPLRAPVLTTLGMRPLSTLYRLCGLSGSARAVISGESATYAAPPNRVSAVVHAAAMDQYIRGGAYYPRGGGQVLAAHLLDVIQAHGGVVRTHTKVERILVENGRTTGVRLASGETINADTVISNADVRRTFLDLVGREHLTDRQADRVSNYRMALPLLTVYLGLDVDLADRMPNTNFYTFPDTDVDGYYEALYRGELPDELPLFITSATVKDPGNPRSAPPGHSTMEIMAVVPQGSPLWGFADAADGSYRGEAAYGDLKERITDRIIARTAELIPGIEGHIVWREAATPLTQERFTLSSHGSSYGLEMAIDQLGRNRPGPVTGIGGLYLTGAGTVFCHGIVNVMNSGVGTASAVLGRDLLTEVKAGRVYGDPTRLTAGGPDWDPLTASKPRLADRPRRAARTK
ncbi:NAD(P)/FAD-dependent oxidoreductase [Saccharothrix sp. NPDC042600]|uniref:phytoene desaturase family protein n=1 Tax=Saccharothrix TaxID=2071 RepID=UPI0033DBD073|nr:NAD(P)/FAD-dependent oxidoreductase [Saccharothrix mutabilis subsp. capreolus]